MWRAHRFAFAKIHIFGKTAKFSANKAHSSGAAPLARDEADEMRKRKKRKGMIFIAK